MIKDTNNDRRKDGEEDVVECECPRFEEHLAGERVGKGELHVVSWSILLDQTTYIEANHVEHDVFVEAIRRQAQHDS